MNEEIKPENVRIHSRADELIACLEGEIAKRDEVIVGLTNSRDFWREKAIAADDELAVIKAQGVVMPERDAVIRKAVGMCNRIPGSTTWNAAEFAYDELAARLNSAPAEQVSVPDERIIPTSAELIQWAWEEEPEETRFQEGYNAAKRWVKMQIEAGIAAPAAPAADAGIVDMYRNLQKVTPYRFKKIQDASITDGGDVMYFHKDRFDAALLADMAAHCAAPATADSDVLECGE